MKKYILIWIFLFLASLAFKSEIYTYIDETGKIVYTNYKGAKNPAGIKKADEGISESLYREYISFIDKFADRYNIDRNLIISVIFVESYFNKNAVSRKGARGLMQLMPATAKRFRVKDIFDPKENIKGGTAYLRYLHDYFSGDIKLVLAAYNAGENAVIKYNGIPPFRETIDYVKKVTDIYSMLNKSVIFVYYDDCGKRLYTNDLSLIPKGISYRRYEINK